MKLAVIAAGALMLASQAAAYTLTPVNKLYSATGTMTFSAAGGPSLTCNVTLMGHINAVGVGMIRSAAFTGSPTCAAIVATGFHWGVYANDASDLKLTKVNVTVAGVNFAPKKLIVPFSGGAISVNSDGMSGTLTTSPTVAIVP